MILQHNNFSNVLSPRRSRPEVKTSTASLNSLSTGADEGRVVLYLINNFLITG
jgi:hypothetical protein